MMIWPTRCSRLIDARSRWAWLCATWLDGDGEGEDGGAGAVVVGRALVGPALGVAEDDATGGAEDDDDGAGAGPLTSRGRTTTAITTASASTTPAASAILARTLPSATILPQKLSHLAGTGLAANRSAPAVA